MKNILLFLQDEQGVTAVEYALIVSLISVAAIGAMTNVGVQIQATFSKVSSVLASVNAAR